MRVLTTMLLLGRCDVAAAQFRPGPTIDLDVPGALERVQRDNPVHYQAIQQTMAGLFARPDADVPRWLRTSFNASDVSYAPVLLASDPPKRRLAFVLDSTRYQSIVTLPHVKDTVRPAR